MLHSHTNLKYLRTAIFLSFIVLLVSAGNSAFASSVFYKMQMIQQQDTTKIKTKKLKDSKLKGVTDTTKKGASDTTKKKIVKPADEKIEYSAEDSTKYSKDHSIIYLYGKARVTYQTFELDADYIEYNSKTNIMFSSGRKDNRNKYVGKPIFKMGKEGTSVADSLYYNIKSGKGRVFNTFSEQEGGFFSGGQSKRQPDNDIDIKGVTYSTCNLPHPHYGLFITKGIVTNKQIITGPVYLKIEDIPLPLGLPFAFFPKPNKRTSGVIIPSVGDDATRGFYFQNGGYYLILNDYWDAKVLGTYYTRGSYGTSITSNYTTRYKYNGSIKIDYESNRYGVEGTPEYTPRKDYSIQWVHTQNANANPGTTFSSSVNIKTSAYNTNTAGGGTNNFNAITENALSSSVNYGKVFGDGMFNFTASGLTSQNTNTKSVDITLPNLTLNMTSFSPFDSKTRIGPQKWYQKLTVGYSMVAANSISTVDSLLFTKHSLNQLRNGVSQTIPVSLNFTALHYFNFTMGGTYLEKWQFQSVRETAIKGVLKNGQVQPYTTAIDTVNGFNRSGEYTLNMGVSTKIYNTAQFNGAKLKALRWVMTPNINMSYHPDFSALSLGNYKNLFYQDGSAVYDPIYGRQKRYSIHDNTLYGGPGEGQAGSISFGLDNTVEAKVASAKDTTGTGTKKIPIIQGLSFSGSYNFLAPSYKLSDIAFSGRSQFTDKLGFTYNGSFNPYKTKDTLYNGATDPTKVLKDRLAIPRLTSFGFSFGYSLNAAAFKARNDKLDAVNNKSTSSGMTPEQAEQLREVNADPNAFVDFKIPWNFTFSYRLDYTRTDAGLTPTLTNTLNFNGDLNMTPKWKVQFTSGYDFQTNGLSPTSFAIYRDMHCWDMSINWIPIGTYRSYNLTIRVKASILQDLKLSKQQAYYTRF